MFAATIVPQPYLHMIKDQPYHMALAHLIGKPGYEDYTQFYRNIGYDPGKFLIMDNGVIEGDPRPIDELLDKALRINADELVLPDVFTDMNATLNASYKAQTYLAGLSIGPQINTMAVAQGAIFSEWIECAKEMLSWPIRTLGIPKVLVKLAGRDGRLYALQALQEFLGDKQVHLLGCWESPLEIKMINQWALSKIIKPVRGTDSAIAYIYAKAGLRMSEAERPGGAIDFLAKDAHEGVLSYNIHMWQKECGVLPLRNDKITNIW